MSTIDERWNIVDTTRAFCQKVLPLVYDESLSYMELVCKLSSKLNEVIENNNNLPQYVKELIKETVNSDDFRQIVGSVLMDTIINVKFPPEGITPAKGDGVTDDTSSIQACLDYANSQGGAVVFFPSGKYLTGTLSIKEETSILGADRYNTSVVLKGGGNTPLLQGAINQSIRNICLDGNMLNQVEENYLIDGTIDMAMFDNVILCDSAHCITADACNNSEFCNVLCKDIGDGVFITAAGNNNLLTNINAEYDINLTGNNNLILSNGLINLDIDKPIQYKTPTKIDKNLGVPFADKNGQQYYLLAYYTGKDISFFPIPFISNFYNGNNLTDALNAAISQNEKCVYIPEGNYSLDDYPNGNINMITDPKANISGSVPMFTSNYNWGSNAFFTEKTGYTNNITKEVNATDEDAGYVNTAHTIVTTVNGENQKSYEWNLLALLNNHSNYGENCAMYAQANKFAIGPVWGGVFEAVDKTGDSVGGMTGIEVDLKANNLLKYNNRYGVQIVAYQNTPSGTLTQMHSGVSVNAKENTLFNNAFEATGTFNKGLDLSQANINQEAILLPTESVISDSNINVSFSNGQIRVFNRATPEKNTYISGNGFFGNFNFQEVAQGKAETENYVPVIVNGETFYLKLYS